MSLKVAAACQPRSLRWNLCAALVLGVVLMPPGAIGETEASSESLEAKSESPTEGDDQEAWREFFERQSERAHWEAACDRRLRRYARRHGVDVARILRLLGEAKGEPDCDAPPPVEPLPPGKESSCVETRASGAFADGVRTGPWEVFNDEGDKIRIDYYENGTVVQTLWLWPVCEEHASANVAR